MKTSTVIWIIVVLIIIAGGAYWYVSSSNAASSALQSGQAAQSQGAQASASGTGEAATDQTLPQPLLSVGSSASLGQYLVAASGMTLYAYANDAANVSNCAGTCATNWPPYAAPAGAPLAVAAGVSGELGTISRADGSAQLTYNGMPLYYYAKDANPGDTNGQGLGGVWKVVAP